MKAYVDYVYEIVKNDIKGLDAIYRDTIIHLVGIYMDSTHCVRRVCWRDADL